MSTYYRNTLTALILLLTFNTSFAQEERPEGEMPDGAQEQVMSNMPKSEMVRMHLDGIAMGMTEMFLNQYHEEVALYKFPDQLIVKGKVDATKYWEVQFKDEEEKAPFEVEEVQEIGNTVFAPYYQMNFKNGQRERKAVLVHFKDNKFYRIYFIK